VLKNHPFSQFFDLFKRVQSCVVSSPALLKQASYLVVRVFNIRGIEKMVRKKSAKITHKKISFQKFCCFILA